MELPKKNFLIGGVLVISFGIIGFLTYQNYSSKQQKPPTANQETDRV